MSQVHGGALEEEAVGHASLPLACEGLGVPPAPCHPPLHPPHPPGQGPQVPASFRWSPCKPLLRTGIRADWNGSRVDRANCSGAGRAGALVRELGPVPSTWHCEREGHGSICSCAATAQVMQWQSKAVLPLSASRNCPCIRCRWARSLKTARDGSGSMSHVGRQGRQRSIAPFCRRLESAAHGPQRLCGVILVGKL
jgi:hypothetical protein